MFAKETYVQRRARLKETVGSGVLLFLGNDEQGLNYEDNTFRYRQDSTFLYYFGLSFAGLSALIDIDEDREIIFGDELSIDYIVWMGTQPTLREKASAVGIADTRPSADLAQYLHKAVQHGQTIHYLPPYRAEHKLKLMDWLGIPPARQEGSVPFIRAVVSQRNYKTDEEIAEIERACDVTADMHIAATRFIRPGMYEYEVVAEMNRQGVMIDLSHASEKTFWDVIELSKTPIICSHSSAMAICKHDRNLTDEQLKALAKNGGVVQLCLLDSYINEDYKNACLMDAIEHIDHIVKVAGIDHVGIGSDFDGGGGIIGCEADNDLIQITVKLIERGYSEEDIAKIWGGNFLRVMELVQR